MTRYRKAAALTCALGLLVVAGCGDDDDGTPPVTRQAPTTPPPATRLRPATPPPAIPRRTGDTAASEDTASGGPGDWGATLDRR